MGVCAFGANPHTKKTITTNAVKKMVIISVQNYAVNRKIERPFVFNYYSLA